MKCEICKQNIENTFLGKIMGTFIKKKTVCSECQRLHKDKLNEMIV